MNGNSRDMTLVEIPSNGLLLHIGVHKSGTTSLQAACRSSRKMLNAADVLYQGPRVKDWSKIDPRASARDVGQTKLESAIGKHNGRVFVSSEFLCSANVAQADRWVSRLAQGRQVRVLITVRSLADLLPSTWQQRVRARASATIHEYEEWLRAVFSEGTPENEVFWGRNDYPAVVARWGAVVGLPNISIVVADRKRPDRLLRLTEQLLALKPSSLEFAEPQHFNTAMSYREVELLRQVKTQTAQLDKEERKALNLRALRAIREAQLGGGGVPLPVWAASRMAEIGVSYADVLRKSGAVVDPNIAEIAESSGSSEETAESVEQVPVSLAARAVLQALRV